MATLQVLRVFCDDDGAWGNELGVFFDGAEVPEERRQAIATELGFSETVYIDDPGRAKYRIFTPGSELPFAGHPSVGAAWLLEREGHHCEVLRPPAGEVGVRRQGDLTFVAAQPEWCPPWEIEQLVTPAAVDALTGAPPGQGMAYLWAWEDEAAGVVRSRCFPVEENVVEDEATGSGAIPLSAALGRPLTIHQGRGSVLYAAPLGDDRAEVGGRVSLGQVREFAV